MKKTAYRHRVHHPPFLFPRTWDGERFETTLFCSLPASLEDCSRVTREE